MNCVGGDTVLFDTDVIICHLRGNNEAAECIRKAEERLISVQTCMELLQGALNRGQQKAAKDFLKDHDFIVLPLEPNIGSRALVYVEEYGLNAGIRTGDAIIAATAVENGIPLTTGNVRHFKSIKELKLVPFKP